MENDLGKEIVKEAEMSPITKANYMRSTHSSPASVKISLTNSGFKRKSRSSSFSMTGFNTGTRPFLLALSRIQLFLSAETLAYPRYAEPIYHPKPQEPRDDS